MRYFLAVLLLTTAGASSAAELMPAPQQNALVRKYCAVCHTDAARNGGLTLQHFDAATAVPSLKAMMLSKMTGGALMETAVRTLSDPEAAAVVSRTMRTGAMAAAGIPIPDKGTIDALLYAFAAGSAGATGWNVEHTDGVTASIVKEMPSSTKPGQAEVYRFIASCNPGTRAGYLQVAWAPAAQHGILMASVDGRAPKRYTVEGDEAMGNNSGLILHGPAALMLTNLPLPLESLTVSELFPDERVTFSFASLPKDARKELSACFASPK